MPRSRVRVFACVAEGVLPRSGLMGETSRWDAAREWLVEKLMNLLGLAVLGGIVLGIAMLDDAASPDVVREVRPEPSSTWIDPCRGQKAEAYEACVDVELGKFDDPE